MSNKDINQVLPRETRVALDVVTAQLAETFAKCGLDVNETDIKKFHQEMQDKKIHVHKIINGPESGYHVLRDGIEVAFIPSIIVENIVI